MTRFKLVVYVILCILSTGCGEPADPTYGSRNDEGRSSQLLPSIRIVDRHLLLRESSLVYDESIRAYKPPAQPRVRRDRTAAGEVPAGLDLDEAKALVLTQILSNVQVSRDELRLRDVTTVLRGVDPQYIGWAITYEQVFMGAVISNRQTRSEVSGISASVFNDDDWDIRIHLSDVVPEEGSDELILSEDEVKRIARSSLHVDESKPHTFKRLEIVYSPGTNSDGNQTPVWMVDVDIPVDLATVKSYLWAHRGGEAGVDAWTGMIVSGNPLDPNWPLDPSHWDQLQDLAADRGGDELPDAERETIERIRVGMPHDEVDKLLRSVALASAKQHLGGSGAYIKFYQLSEDTQLKVHIGGSYSLFGKVVHVDHIEPKEKWRGLSFSVNDEEASKAADIAGAHLNASIADGVLLDEKYKTSPAGRPVSRALPQITVELDAEGSGESKAYTVTAFGRYMTHRLVHLDFVSDAQWKYRVTVDLDDEMVVPTSWEPTPKDIEKARVIADPGLADFVGSTDDDRNAVKVVGWGKYDYGPTRRLVVLVYSKPSEPKGFGRSSKSAHVDIDNGVLSD